jgi:glutamate mutase epsilon subunit
MTNEQKAQKYNQLMYEYTQIQNKISSIKSESFELNENQIREVKILENQLKKIMHLASLL